MVRAIWRPRRVRGGRRLWRVAWVLAAAAATLASPPAAAGGFGLYHQSGKAAGMAGAWVAQARDPSALFYNPGALALLTAEQPKFSGGLAVLDVEESFYRGQPPGVGAGTTAEQVGPRQVLPHAFLARRLGSGLTVALGAYSPFVLETEWARPDAFAGRYATTRASLSTLDLSVGAALTVGRGLGLGASVVYRTSELDHRRRLASFDPAAGRVVDVAGQVTETGRDDGLGFGVGVLRRSAAGLSWGASYRSAIEIDYSGTATLTQIATGNPGLDALIAATVPFDQTLEAASRIEFPDLLAVGVALRPTVRTTVELDWNRVGWGAIQELALRLPDNSELDQGFFLGLQDGESYRLGARFESRAGTIWRGGVSLEESPLPDAALGALFPDGDRTSYALGFSRRWLDVAFVWTEVEDRGVDTSTDGLNGVYGGKTYLLAVTVNR